MRCGAVRERGCESRGILRGRHDDAPAARRVTRCFSCRLERASRAHAQTKTAAAQSIGKNAIYLPLWFPAAIRLITRRLEKNVTRDQAELVGLAGQLVVLQQEVPTAKGEWCSSCVNCEVDVYRTVRAPNALHAALPLFGGICQQSIRLRLVRAGRGCGNAMIKQAAA